MIKIGKFYIFKNDISYLEYYECSTGRYEITFTLKSSDNYFTEHISVEEFKRLQKLLIVEDNDEN